MKCTFCGKELPPVGLTILVKRTGESVRFCNSKCEKSYLMGRDSRKKKWVRKRKD